MKMVQRLERAAVRRLLSAPNGVLERLAGPTRSSPDGLALDLQTQALLRVAELIREPELTAGSVDEARRRLARTAPMLDYEVPDDVTLEVTPAPGGEGKREARLYRPARADGSAIVWFHGGGFVLGSPRAFDGVCSRLALLSGATVVSIDYRLAPEHPFPAGFDDAVAATRWLLRDGRSLGLDPARVAIGGDSAGGNLAAAVSLALRDDPAPRLRFQLLVYPALDFTKSGESYRLFPTGYLLTDASIDWFVQHYLGGRELKKDPRVSPFWTNSVSGAPPALVLTGGFDPLRDEGEQFAKRLAREGGGAELVRADGLVHGFFSMGGVVRAADRLIELAASRLRRALA